MPLSRNQQRRARVSGTEGEPHTPSSIPYNWHGYQRRLRVLDSPSFPGKARQRAAAPHNDSLTNGQSPPFGRPVSRGWPCRQEPGARGDWAGRGVRRPALLRSSRLSRAPIGTDILQASGGGLVTLGHPQMGQPSASRGVFACIVNATRSPDQRRSQPKRATSGSGSPSRAFREDTAPL